MKFAYIASTATLPGSATRRSDAFEHDRMMEELHRGAPLGVTWVDVAWDDPAADWAAFDAAIIGTAWDYWDRQSEFLGTLTMISEKTRLFNSPETVTWNIHKSYLKELEARGANLIPTLWLDKATPAHIEAAFEKLNTDDLVLKRQVGAGADGQHRIRRGAPIPAMPHPMMAQPFLSAILEEGEYSFVFIDGALSHALVKRAADNDYRIQSSYGGTDHSITPPAADVRMAKMVLDKVDTGDGRAPLYARVDMLRDKGGGLLLMELELIEPFLYPLEGPGLGEKLAQSIMARVLS